LPPPSSSDGGDAADAAEAAHAAPDATDGAATACPVDQPALGARAACVGTLTCSYGTSYCCGIKSTAFTCSCQHGFFSCAQTVECNFICPEAGD
jgi:hypothetical protein